MRSSMPQSSTVDHQSYLREVSKLRFARGAMLRCATIQLKLTSSSAQDRRAHNQRGSFHRTLCIRSEQ